MVLEESYLINRVSRYVAESLKNFRSNTVQTPKVIHDSVHGTNIFRPFEIAFLDLPIVQRLRRISQTDVSAYVFPAGNHNRFEHTIGVASVVGMMVDSLFSRKRPGIDISISKKYIYDNCRIAAILHDCGHGPFSHLSEQVYGDNFTNLKNENVVLSGATAHEILSYYIIKSEPLKNFNETVIKGQYGVDIDLDFVANMVVGYIDKIKYPTTGFAIELINGAFDADKLDYILRDAHSTGLKMALDLPRIMYTLDVIPDKDKVPRLTLDISGVAALEEIIFDKMMLFSTIYHHHKIRAAGCLLKSVFKRSKFFSDAPDYLYYTDDQIYNISHDDPIIDNYLQLLKKRILPKRAFCISPRTLDDITQLGKLMCKLLDPEIGKSVIENICYYAKINYGTDILKEYVWIDLPNTPKFKEATHCIIRSEGAPDDCLLLRDVFPTDDWARAFSENKWQGFIYTMPEYCDVVAKVTKMVLESIFDVSFNNFAISLCKIK